MTDKPEAVEAAAKWLRECSAWMLTNDLDMRCPMEADPLDLAEALEATSSQDASALVEALRATQTELERIVHTKATDFHAVHLLILGIRAALQAWEQSNAGL